PRGLWPERDAALTRELADSEKDRAENVMIVDMLRNDLGRICETGSIRVKSLFDVERYETIWQMTSTISGRTRADVPEIFRALFPSASVTGAPKVRTMQIIRELETGPRGVYCGSVGWWSPDRRAEFNVAIRTLTLEAETGCAVYPVGSGVTWDSSTEAEYDECIAKAVAVRRPRPEFELLESLLFDGAYFLLEEHLDRLEASAGYFGFRFDRDETRRALMDHVSGVDGGPRKVRLLLASSGRSTIQSELAPSPSPVQVRLATKPVSTEDVFLYHKTTHRSAYDEALSGAEACDDVILWNECGELTESTRANIVVELNGERLTPPIECGLLAGVMRRHLLETGAIREEVLRVGVLQRATCVWLVNSVRCWVEAAVVTSE
ncbi:MAG: chorismate-binding protein, partial [Candidatus Hydrogenedentota bacterium]